MKLYKDNSKAKSYFYYFGWSIPVFIGVFFLIFFLIFQAVFYVKRTERIEIFIAAHGLKDDSYFESIRKEFAKDGLLEVNVYSYLEDDPSVYRYFEANGESADFIIFSETNVEDMQEYITYNYVDVSTLVEDIPCLNEYENYVYDNIPYGVKVFDGNNASYNESHHFQDIIEFTKQGKDNESYYLLVDKDSPNFDKKSKHTFGYSVLEYLLKDMIN